MGEKRQYRVAIHEGSIRLLHGRLEPENRTDQWGQLPITNYHNQTIKQYKAPFGRSWGFFFCAQHCKDDLSNGPVRRRIPLSAVVDPLCSLLFVCIPCATLATPAQHIFVMSCGRRSTHGPLCHWLLLGSPFTLPSSPHLYAALVVRIKCTSEYNIVDICTTFRAARRPPRPLATIRTSLNPRRYLACDHAM